MASGSGKVFVLGVGAQKAGTTWLSAYLNTRDDVDVGFRKEYHVFDAAELDAMSYMLERIENRVATSVTNGKSSWKGDSNITRMSFMADYRNYFAYFADLLRPAKISISADITPSYSGLSVETFRMIKSEFNARDIRVVPVFLMRDPVDRLYSALRMAHRNNNVKSTLENDIELLNRTSKSAKTEVRANYHRTISNIEAVFGEDIFLSFYEELFGDAAIEDLCTHLGVPFMPGKYDEKVNSSDKSHELPLDVRKSIASGYTETFDMLADRFGADRLANIWPSYAAVRG